MIELIKKRSDKVADNKIMNRLRSQNERNKIAVRHKMQKVALRKAIWPSNILTPEFRGLQLLRNKEECS